MRLPGQVVVKPIQSFCCAEQLRCSFARINGARHSGAAAHELHLGAHPSDLSLLQLGQGRQFGDRKEFVRRLGRGDFSFGLGGSNCPRSAKDRVRREYGRALQEGRCRRDTTPPLRAAGRGLQFRGYRIIGSRRGVGGVPCPTVRIRLRIGHGGRRPMDLAALGEFGGAVGGRAHQRMGEAHPRAELDQTRGFGRRQRVDRNA